MQLNNQVAIVTGASKGIGKAISIGLAKAGVNVQLCSRTLDDLNKVKLEISNLGFKANAFPCDLRSQINVEKMVDEIYQTNGKIDILINCAGGFPTEMYSKENLQPLKIWEWTEEKWDTIISTNLKTTFLCIAKTLPIMIKQRSGNIVNISSRMGRIASEMGAYAAAKAAIIALTKTAAIQSAEYGIKVNVVSPGIIDTEGQRQYNNAIGNTDIQMGSQEDVLKAVLYLLCDSPQAMTGQSMDLFRTV